MKKSRGLFGVAFMLLVVFGIVFLLSAGLVNAEDCPGQTKPTPNCCAEARLSAFSYKVSEPSDVYIDGNDKASVLGSINSNLPAGSEPYANLATSISTVEYNAHVIVPLSMNVYGGANNWCTSKDLSTDCSSASIGNCGLSVTFGDSGGGAINCKDVTVPGSSPEFDCTGEFKSSNVGKAFRPKAVLSMSGNPNGNIAYAPPFVVAKSLYGAFWEGIGLRQFMEDYASYVSSGEWNRGVTGAVIPVRINTPLSKSGGDLRDVLLKEILEDESGNILVYVPSSIRGSIEETYLKFTGGANTYITSIDELGESNEDRYLRGLLAGERGFLRALKHEPKEQAKESLEMALTAIFSQSGFAAYSVMLSTMVTQGIVSQVETAATEAHLAKLKEIGKVRNDIFAAKIEYEGIISRFKNLNSEIIEEVVGLCVPRGCDRGLEHTRRYLGVSNRDDLMSTWNKLWEDDPDAYHRLKELENRMRSGLSRYDELGPLSSVTTAVTNSNLPESAKRVVKAAAAEEDWISKIQEESDLRKNVKITGYYYNVKNQLYDEAITKVYVEKHGVNAVEVLQEEYNKYKELKKFDPDVARLDMPTIKEFIANNPERYSAELEPFLKGMGDASRDLTLAEKKVNAASEAVDVAAKLSKATKAAAGIVEEVPKFTQKALVSKAAGTGAAEEGVFGRLLNVFKLTGKRAASGNAAGIAAGFLIRPGIESYESFQRETAQ